MKPTVIVGMGTCGTYLAHQLVLKGKKVILLEAGGDKISSFHHSEFDSCGHQNNGLSIGRARGFGGTSNLWGGQFAEFVKSDLLKDNVYGQPSWPLEWDELERYYRLVYTSFGFRSERFAEDLEFTSRHNENYLLELFYTRWLKVPSLKQMFLSELMNSTCVEVIDNAFLYDLVFEGSVCTELKYISQGQISSISGFESVVLANGTLEIVRSLLISARNDVPFKDNKFLGLYFQDHIYLNVGRIKNPSKEFIDKFSNEFRLGEKLQPKLRLKLIDKRADIQISGFLQFNSSISEHLDLFKQFIKALTGKVKMKSLKDFILISLSILKVLPVMVPIIYKYLKYNKIYNPLGSEVHFGIQAQQISIENSCIRISEQELDINGRPRLVLNWQIDGREIETIKRFIHLFDEYLVSNKYGKLEVGKDLLGAIETEQTDWREYVTDIYHHSGGAIMSISPDSGVVDSNLCVWNTSNLYVAGGAVLPTSSYANTGLTLLALTHRLSDFLTKSQ